MGSIRGRRARHVAFAAVAAVLLLGILRASSSTFTTTPSSLNFEVQVPGTTSSARTFVIRNTAKNAMVFTMTVSGDFTASSGCNSTLPPGRSCTISVRFAPKALGLRTGRVVITERNKDKGTEIVPLSGRGVPATTVFPAALQFGRVAIDTEGARRSVTLTNNQDVPLTGISFSASNGNFSASGCPATLPARGSCRAAVTFAPSEAVGVEHATLQIVHNAPTSPQSVALTGTSVLPIVVTPTTLTFRPTGQGLTSYATATLTNNLNVPLTGVVLTTAAPFRATGCYRPVAPRRSCTITVTFSPTNETGDVAGLLSVRANQTSRQPVVNLSGTAVLPINVTPTELDFESVNVGTDSAGKVVTLRNTQRRTVTLGSPLATFEGPAAADFAQTSTTCARRLGAMASCTITVRFRPSTNDARQATLLVHHNTAGGVQRVALSGTGANGVAVSPLTLTFLSQPLNTNSAAQQVTVTNNQSVTASLSTSVTGDFSATNGCSDLVPASGSCSVSVVFRPTAVGQRNGSATVTVGGTPFEISLSGIGEAETPPGPTPAPAITSVQPGTGTAGTVVLGVVITGNGDTHFTVGSTVGFGPGLTASNLRNVSANSLTVDVEIAPNAAAGARAVTVTTALAGGGSETASLDSAFSVNASASLTLTSISPETGKQGQTLDVAIVGAGSHFRQGVTTATFGTGVTVNSLTVQDQTHATANVSVSPITTLGWRQVVLITGGEAARLTPVPPGGPGFNVVAGDAVLTSVSPATGQQGASQLTTTVTGSGTHFVQGTTQVSFGAGITVSNVQVASSTELTVSLAVNLAAAVGPRDVVAVTAGEVASRAAAFSVTQKVSVPVPHTGGPYTGTAGIAVAFDASQSTDPDSNLLTFSWDFGDGSTGSGVAPFHTYAAAGQYTVTLNVDNGHGGTASASTTAAISASSSSATTGFVRGETFDDSKSLPLPAPTVTLVGGGAQSLMAGSMTGATSGDEQGRFLAQASEGPVLVEISAEGFTSVYRTASVTGRGSVTLLDARLTPLAPAQPITSALGGVAQTPNGLQSVQFVAGALQADTPVAITPLSAQGLPARLPFGWSPVAALDVRPFATNLGVPAVWRVLNLAGIPRARELTLARFDLTTHAWVAAGAATVSVDGQFVEAPLDRLATWVIVAPDGAPFTPPAPQTGTELAGVTLPQSGGSFTATGKVTPRTSPPGELARAIGEVVLQSDQPLVSGLRLQGRVTQRFDLQDGAAVVPVPFTQDLLAFTDPRTGLTNELRAAVPITPSRNYTLQELLLGVVQVDVHQPGADVDGSIVDVGGGSFDDGAGGRVTVPTGALTAQTVIDLLPLPRDQLSAPVPASLEFLGGVRFGLVGTSLAQSASISIPKPASLAADAQILLAQTFIDFLGVPHLRVVAVGVIDGSRIVSSTDVGGIQLPGVVTGGEYTFVRAATPLGFARGTVFGPNGVSPQALALATAETGPFADLTNGSGLYLTMTPAAAASLVIATDAAGNAGSSSVTPPAPNAVVTANVTLAASLPLVVASDPTRGAARVALDTGLRIQFSKAMAPASVTDASVVLQQGTTPITLRRFLSTDGRTLTLLPDQPLASATSYQLILTSDLRDLVGNALAPFQPLPFTTLDTSRQTTQPGQLVARLPDDDGIAMLFASAGTAEPSALVSVINLRSQETMTVVAQSDGSFRLRILAALGDELTVHFRNAAGQEADFKITQFENEDGLAGLGASGGTVRGPSGRLATVLPRALVKAGTFRLLDGSTQGLPPLPAGVSVVDTMTLTLGGPEFNTLASLTLSETQARFAPATATAFPFSASGSLVVSPDFLVGGALKFRGIAVDGQGNQSRVDGSTTVRSSNPDGTPVEAASEARFPRVFVSSPLEALPNQQVEAIAVAPTARVEFDLPVPAGAPLAGYLLARETRVGESPKLAVLDTLAVVTVGNGTRLRTGGRGFPGVSRSGSYAVVGSTTPFAFATGRLTGAALTVEVADSPFVFEADGPNASFIVPIPVSGAFTLRFVDGTTGELKGTFDGQSNGGIVNVGEPLGGAAATMTLTSQPDETWVVGIDMPIKFVFSEPVDAKTVNASTIVVTDGAGLRVFGTFKVLEDTRTVTFTPLRRFRYATKYRYSVTNRVMAVSGAKLQAAHAREFTTFEPKTLATPDIGEPVRDVAMSGGLALAAGQSGLTVVGISNPLQPAIQSRVTQAGGSSGVALGPTGFTNRNGAPVAGPVAIGSGGNTTTGGGVVVAGLENPATPLMYGSARLSPAGGPGSGRIAIDGTKAAVLDGTGVALIDITQTVPPDAANDARGVLARATVTGARDVAWVAGKVVVVGDAGLTVLDGSTLDVLGTRADDGAAVSVDGLGQFDMDIDGNGTIEATSERLDLVLAGGLADGTLRFYDISKPATIRLVGVVHLAGNALDVSLSRSEQLAYVAADLAGVVIVDLKGPASIQPLDTDFNGGDDRILGTIATAASASRVSADGGRGIAVAGTGQRLTIIRVTVPRAQILSVLRDPVLVAANDEQPLTNATDLYTTDDAIIVSVETGETSAFLSVVETPTSDPLLALAGSGPAQSLAAGRSAITLLLNHTGSIERNKVAIIQLSDASGKQLDSLKVHLGAPDLSNTRVRSLYFGVPELRIGPATATAQVSVGAHLDDGRNVNVTDSRTGTIFTSANTAVATVDANGLVTGKAGGSTTVVTSNGNELGTMSVTVDLPLAITDIWFGSQYVLIENLERAIPTALFGRFSDRHVTPLLPESGVTYASSNSEVVSVDSSGVLTAHSSGDVLLSATVDGLEAQSFVGVELATPVQLAAIVLSPFLSPIDASDGSAIATVQLIGTGSFAGVRVSIDISLPGGRHFSGLAEIDGTVHIRLTDLKTLGNWTVTASCEDSDGETFADSQSLRIEPVNVDLEGDTSPVPVSLETTVRGTIGVGDTTDTFAVTATSEGVLRVKLHMTFVDPNGRATLVVRSSGGTELARVELSDGTTDAAVHVEAGTVYLSVESNASAKYDVSSTLGQDPVLVTSITPGSGPAGTVVTIVGSGFTAPTDRRLVLFGGVPAAVISANSSLLVVRVPALAVDGYLQLIVGEQSALAGYFSVGSPGPALAITQDDPTPPVIRQTQSGRPIYVNRLDLYASPDASAQDVAQLVEPRGGVIIQVVPSLAKFSITFPASSSLQHIETLRRTLATSVTVRAAKLVETVEVSATPRKFDTEGFVPALKAIWKSTDGAYTVPWSAYELIRAFEAAGEVLEVREARALGPTRQVDVVVVDSGFYFPNTESNGEFAFTRRDSGAGLRVRQPVLGSERDSWPTSEMRDNQSEAHGSAVTSIIAAKSNSFGMSGILGAITERVSVDVYDAHGSTITTLDPRKLISAVVDAAARRVDDSTPRVINLSASSCDFRLLASRNPEIVFVQSAGNKNENVDTKCGNTPIPPNMFFVGATGNQDRDQTGEMGAERAIFGDTTTAGSKECSQWAFEASSCGNLINLVAPGEEVLAYDDPYSPYGGSPGMESYYAGSFGGTSAAAPLVSGVAALVLASSPQALSAKDVRALLVNAGTDVTHEWRHQVHAGIDNSDRFRRQSNPLRRVDALAAVRRLFAGFDYPRIFIGDGAERAVPLQLAPSQVASVAVALDGTPEFEATERAIGLGADPKLRALNWLTTNVSQEPVLIALTGVNSLVLSPTRDEAFAIANAVSLGSTGVAIVNTKSLSVQDFVPLESQGVGEGDVRKALQAADRNALAVSPDGHLLFVAVTTGCTSEVPAVQVQCGVLIVNLDREKPALVADWSDLLSSDLVSVTHPAASRVLDRLLDIQKDLVTERSVPVGLALSRDGRTLFVFTGVGKSGRSRILEIDVDLTKDGDETFGRQVNLSSFLTLRGNALSLQALMPNGGPDALKDFATSRNASTAYGVFGAYRFRPSSSSQTKVDSPGPIVPIRPSSNVAGSALPLVPTKSVFGTAAREDLPRTPALAPSAVALSDDGRRGLVSFFLTGNFGLLDLDRQGQYFGSSGGGGAGPFSGYVGRSPAIELDPELWPQSPEDVSRLYPVDLAVSQNGRIGVAAHAGSSGHAKCAAAPSDYACTQHGGISIIDVEAMSRDAAQHVAEPTSWQGVPTSFFSRNPLCGAPVLPSGVELSECESRGLSDPAVFGRFITLRDANKIQFTSPRTVAIEPVATIKAPLAGAFATLDSPVSFSWKTSVETSVDGWALEVTSRDGSSSYVPIGREFTEGEAEARFVSTKVGDLFGPGSNPPPGWYTLELRVIAGPEFCATGTRPCVASATQVEFELAPPRAP